LETGAEAWFIPAGKEAPGISGFELRAEDGLFRARALFLVLGVKEALALLINLAGEREGEGVFSDGELVRQRKGKQLLPGIELDGGFRERFVVDGRRIDFKLEGVEDDLTNGGADVNLDRLGTGEGEFVEMRDDADGVIGGEDLFGQFAGGGGEIVRFFGVHGGEEREEEEEKEKGTFGHGGLKAQSGKLKAERGTMNRRIVRGVSFFGSAALRGVEMGTREGERLRAEAMQPARLPLQKRRGERSRRKNGSGTTG